MGGCEALALVGVESTLKYHPECIRILTLCRYPAREQCQVGSLTGAVASIVGRPDGDIRGKPGCMLESPFLSFELIRYQLK